MPSLLIVLLLWIGIAWNSLADWQLEGPVEKPRYGVFWSMSHGGNWPPAPCVPLLFSDAPVYKITGEGIPDDYFLYDDTEDPLHSGNSLMSMLLEEESDPESDNPPVPPPGPDAFGTNLWLVISNFTGTTIPLAILNTTNGLPYEVLSATNVLAPLSNWISEGIWVGQATNTPAWAELGERTNQLFFIAHQWDGTWRYGVPTNGQLFMQIQSSPIHPIIDGTTNTLYASFANWLILNPSNQHVLNLGYDANDGGITNSWLTTNAQQGVIQFYGVSKTITNLCLSYNPLTNLSVSRWPALQSVDAWHCTNMLAVYVTNAPELRRVCFEAFQYDTSHGITNTLDFSGCPKIAEIRAADNRFPNVAITNGAGPEVWHLCLHNNTVNQLPSSFDFSHLPSLRDLWVWANQFTGHLPLSSANSTNLISVEIFNNNFTSADFGGQTNLDHVLIDGNSNLTNLNLSGCSKLVRVDASFDKLSQSSVDAALFALDENGIYNNGGNSPIANFAGGNNKAPSVGGVRP